MLYRRPYWNNWWILLMVFLIWHALYTWILNGIIDGKFMFGDDASTALLTGAFSIAGLMLAQARKFVPDQPIQGRALMPNLLCYVSAATVVVLEVIGMGVTAIALDAIDLKGVAIGMVIASSFGFATTMLGIGTSLVEEDSTDS